MMIITNTITKTLGSAHGDASDWESSTAEVHTTTASSLGLINDYTVNFFQTIDPHFRVQVVSVTGLECNLGGVDAVPC